ncbi:hypothetical protein HK104_003164 [Borealophlyctis nickersoniae]|nr:hypothetical protein HK104_003164 [Borealophlyctis nickersoniae]
MAKLRREMQEAETEHQDHVSELERTLLEARMKFQKEAEAKIRAMESAAHEKASKYLSDHTTTLEAENARLAHQLRACISRTQDLISRKDTLEQENKKLEREKAVREAILRVRVKKIVGAEKAMVRERDKRRVVVREGRRKVVERVVAEMEKERTPDTDKSGLKVEAEDVDWSDDEEDEYM